MKKYLKKFIYFLIECIEKIEYRKLSLDENDISKKILNTYDLDNIHVKSDIGYVPATNFHITQPYKIYEIKLENGLSLKCADNHIVFTNKLKEIFVKDLTTNDYLFTDIGESKVISINILKHKVSMCDLTVDHPNHRYYTSGILSHNTVSAAIAILHYIIFNNDKTVMVVANKGDTVIEIVDKIKAIYYLLPWHLKPGVSNWNQTQVTFDTGCRIRTSAATKSAGIGFTVDFLYLDEFAHIQSNIIEDYYRSVFPTVAAVKNSKIVITSTPNGYNLFYKILAGSEKPVGDKEKNNYKSLRVYWWQVPGRYVTYIRLDPFLCEKFKISPNDFYKYISDMGFKTNLSYSKQDMRYEIHVENRKEFLPDFINEENKGKESDNIISDYFRGLIYEVNDNKYRVKDFADISSWKEDAIKDIGGEDNFNQEFDLQFANGNRVLFDSQTLDKLANEKVPFTYEQIDKLDRRTFLKYEDLKWISDRHDIFELSQIKNYHIVFAVDLSEGLGQDFSVINIFRVMNKPETEWPKNVDGLYDLFKLEQIGIYKNNIVSVSELAEILYLLCFELCDPNKIGVVLEVNAFGGELITNMRELWNGRNEFSNHIFFRYKHREDAIKKDIGLKVRSNKNLFVRDYQKRIKVGDIIIHEEETLKEMTTFVKKESRAGNIIFEADSGHDDIVMTIVATSTTFDNSLLHELISNYMSSLPDSIKSAMEKKIGENPNINGADYSILFKAQQRSGGGNSWGNGYGNSGNTIWNNPWTNK